MVDKAMPNLYIVKRRRCSDFVPLFRHNIVSKIVNFEFLLDVFNLPYQKHFHFWTVFYFILHDKILSNYNVSLTKRRLNNSFDRNMQMRFSTSPHQPIVQIPLLEIILSRRNSVLFLVQIQ